MKYIYISILSFLILSSCVKRCDNVISGQVFDIDTNELISDVKISITAIKITRRLNYITTEEHTILDPLYSDLEGNYSVVLNTEYEEYNYNLEKTGYITETSSSKITISQCGHNELNLYLKKL